MCSILCLVMLVNLANNNLLHIFYLVFTSRSAHFIDCLVLCSTFRLFFLKTEAPVFGACLGEATCMTTRLHWGSILSPANKILWCRTPGFGSGRSKPWIEKSTSWPWLGPNSHFTLVSSFCSKLQGPVCMKCLVPFVTRMCNSWWRKIARKSSATIPLPYPLLSFHFARTIARFGKMSAWRFSEAFPPAAPAPCGVSSTQWHHLICGFGQDSVSPSSRQIWRGLTENKSHWTLRRNLLFRIPWKKKFNMTEQ